MSSLTLNLRPDVTVLAVPVPSDMHSFQLGRTINAQNKIYAQCENGGCRIDLPPGSYELIGLLRGLQEIQAAALVDRYIEERGRTNSYRIGDITCFHPRTALKLLIEQAGGDPKQNWLLIKKIA